VFSVPTVYIRGSVRGETCQNTFKELRSKYFILCATKSGYSKEKRVELDIVKGVLFLPVITLLLIQGMDSDCALDSLENGYINTRNNFIIGFRTLKRPLIY